MPIDRKEQQAELIYKLGELLRPITEVITYPEDQTAQTRARATAKYAIDMTLFDRQALEFSKGEPGHAYTIEYNAIRGGLLGLQHELGLWRDDNIELGIVLERHRNKILGQILRIPTEVDSEVLEAHSPFQAYCKLKVFFEATSDCLIWSDPYMGPSLFHRYLNHLPSTVNVTLITQDRGTHSEYQSFLDVSRLYARERGQDKYRLIVENSQHDRWLQCDQQLYTLGGSAKDAGRRSSFTIAKLPPTKDNFQQLQDLINSGTEIFGHGQTSHL